MPLYIYSNWICDLASKINGFKVGGIEFIPFVIILRKGASEQLKNHETIHYKQMMECLIVFWYLIYIGHYLYNLIKFKDHKSAYRAICFEKEAYSKQGSALYLYTRPRFAWIKEF